MTLPLGLIVCGEDHFLIRGVKPDLEMARYLVRRWTFPSVDDVLGLSPPMPSGWRITTKEFREDISWVIVLACSSVVSEAVRQLLIDSGGDEIKQACLQGLIGTHDLEFLREAPDEFAGGADILKTE